MGRAIRLGSRYIPIRHLAGRASAVAPPKRYWKQIAAIYHAITRDWWHYTYDPVGAEVLTLDGPRIYALTLNQGRTGRLGYGDCDDIAVAAGALLMSIGMHVVIATTAAPNSPYIFDHVFLIVKPPRCRTWKFFDPVLYDPELHPGRGFGDIAKHDRLAVWDLDTRLLEKRGSFPPRFDEVMNLYGFGQAAGF